MFACGFSFIIIYPLKRKFSRFDLRTRPYLWLHPSIHIWKQHSTFVSHWYLFINFIIFVCFFCVAAERCIHLNISVYKCEYANELTRNTFMNTNCIMPMWMCVFLMQNAVKHPFEIGRLIEKGENQHRMEKKKTEAERGKKPINWDQRLDNGPMKVIEHWTENAENIYSHTWQARHGDNLWTKTLWYINFFIVLTRRMKKRCKCSSIKI